jgi:hypothetical protein
MDGYSTQLLRDQAGLLRKMEKVGSVATSPSYTKMEWAADEIERLSAELAEAKAEIKALKQNYSYRLEQIEAIQQVIGTEFARAKALRGGE